MIKKYFSLLALFIVWNASAQEMQTLRINPDDALGGNESQFFDSVTYIPLETTKESLFGFVHNIQVTDRYFVFTDFDTNATLMFYKNGKFYRRLTMAGFQTKGVRIDPHNGNIGVQYENSKADQDPELRSLMAEGNLGKAMAMISKFIRYAIYDQNGVYLRDSTMQHPMSEALGVGRLDFGAIPNINGVAKIGYLVNTFLGEKLQYQFAPFDRSIFNKPMTHKLQQMMSAANGDMSHSVIDTIRFCTLPFDYSVYMLQPHNYFEVMKFIFPESYSIPKLYHSDTLFSNLAIADYLNENKNVITSISDFDMHDKRIFCTLNYVNINNDRPKHLMIDLIPNILYDLDKISPDTSNCLLPLADWYNSLYKDSVYYSSISSLAMFQSKEQNKEKKITYPSNLQTFYANETQKSNPVIVQFKMKKQL